MQRKRKIDSQDGEIEAKRRRLSTDETFNFQNFSNLEPESAEEPNDTSSASKNNKHINASGNNNITQIGMPNSKYTFIKKVSGFSVPELTMQYQIGFITTNEDLDDTMSLFTLNKDDDELESARQVINYQGASAVYFTHACWMLFAINKSRGWNKELLNSFRNLMVPDLTVNFRWTDETKRTLFPKRIDDRMLMTPVAPFWEWEYCCNCNSEVDQHRPQIVEDSPDFSKDDTLPGNHYAILCPDRNIATCCASWLFSGAMVNRHTFNSPMVERSVVVQLTIMADVKDDDFILNLKKITRGQKSIIIVLEKANSTNIIAVLQHQTWISIWASYFSGNNGKDGVLHVRPPILLSWVEWIERPKGVVASASSDHNTELSVVADSPSWNRLHDFEGLKSLSLVNVDWSVAQFATIAKLVKLDTLRLDYCHNLSNECLLNLVNLKLTSLSVNGCQWFDNQSSRYLSQIDTLKELSLRNCYGVTNIDGFSFVDVLDVSGCWQIFSEVIQDFKKKWPHIYITKQFEYATHPIDVLSNYDWMDIYREQILTQSP